LARGGSTLSSLVISGLSGFKSLRFERRCPIRGVPPERTPPNLDVLAEGETIVGIESKLIEQIRIGATAHFSAAYDDAITELADDAWRSAIERLKLSPSCFQSFDAGQIAKHYLGMKTAFGTCKPMVLIYASARSRPPSLRDRRGRTRAAGDLTLLLDRPGRPAHRRAPFAGALLNRHP
jgi:hypothetical protein